VITDAYDRKARLYPALLLFMPVVLVIACGLGKDTSRAEALVGAFLSCGGLLLLTQIARDAGKKKESRLFETWGGMPSVIIFRHADASIDPITKARYHNKMSSLIKEAKAPSAEEETADPIAADRIYGSWSTFIRINTRDTKKYPLLFQENISYGYRRNTWGLRPLGITVTCACVVGALAWIYAEHRSTGRISFELITASVVSLILLLLWLFYFTSEWVHIPAKAYAERLVESIDSLGPKFATRK